MNRIPQSVIRSIVEGPLQPVDASKKHPELVPQDVFAKKVAEVLHRNNPLLNNHTANISEEKIQDDITTMASASPRVKYAAKQENIKKASASSLDKNERQEAIENSKCASNRNTVLESNVIRPVRSADVADTSLTKGFNGGTSMIHVEEIETADQRLSRASRESNLNKKLAVKDSRMDKSANAADQRCEEQKAKKMSDSYNSYANNNLISPAGFGSSNQYAPQMPESNFDKDYITAFKSKMPEFDNLPKDMKRISSVIKNYQLEKMNSQYAGINKSWTQASLDEINDKLNHATAKANELTSEEEINRNRTAKTEVPSIDALKAALNKKIADKIDNTKGENIKTAKKIKVDRNLRNDASKRAEPSKPTTNIVDSMLKIYKAEN